MKVLLITNYRKDNQKSMIRFGNLLSLGDYKNIVITEIFPLPRMINLCVKSNFKKWAGYIDKYIIFPRKIEALLKKKSYDIIHIIDHSNSVYLKKISKLTKATKVSTCHDLIAVRTAHDEFDMAPQTSNSGKRLQKWIEKSLNYSDFFACDSLQTQSDLNNRIPKSCGRSKVIHLGIEQFKSTNTVNINPTEFCLKSNKYILHVGSDSWYKNRKGVIKSFIFSNEKRKDVINKLVLVGPSLKSHELDPKIESWRKKNNDKIIVLSDLSEGHLNSLYLNARLLIFPSYIEGFGWPPMESVARGCPTISTKTGAIYEILKDNVTYADPYDQKKLNDIVFKSLLKSPKKRIINSLPTKEDCVEKYEKLYRDIAIPNS
jgi:glycosyltransferase involved in cell wall biosynthesis